MLSPANRLTFPPPSANGSHGGAAQAVEDVRDRPDADKPKSLAAAVEPLLVPAAEAAKLCGISEATWYRLKAAGKTPAPLKLGRVLYRLADLRLWVEWGCCDRKTFEARKSAQGGNSRPR